MSGLGAAVHAETTLWPVRAGEAWTFALLTAGGLGVRQSARQVYYWREARPQAAETELALGPEAGLGLQLASASVALRLGAVDRADLLGGFEQHVVLVAGVLFDL